MQISEVQPQFSTTPQPSIYDHAPLNTHDIPKRGRPRKIPKMPVSAESTSTVNDADSGNVGKWGMDFVTKFACKLCGQSFNHQPSLFRHQITAHGREKKTHGQNPTAVNDGDVDKWGMVLMKKFACRLCGQSFSHQPSLFRHQITVHGREKKTCGRKPTATEQYLCSEGLSD